MEATKRSFRKTLNGVVVSSGNDKTIIVKVLRRFKHPLYGKFVNQTKKFHAHDEKNVAKTGDRVVIIESKPFSKLKKWQLVRVAQ